MRGIDKIKKERKKREEKKDKRRERRGKEWGEGGGEGNKYKHTSSLENFPKRRNLREGEHCYHNVKTSKDSLRYSTRSRQTNHQQVWLGKH